MSSEFQDGNLPQKRFRAVLVAVVVELEKNEASSSGREDFIIINLKDKG